MYCFKCGEEPWKCKCGKSGEVSRKSESDGSVFPLRVDYCSIGCNRPAKLDSIHKTTIGDVPLYLCRYCKGWKTRRGKTEHGNNHA